MVEKEKWNEISCETSAHKKMELLQSILLGKYNEFFPEKTRTICSDEQPFFTNKLENLKRRKSREFHKRRKSNKWKVMDEEYEAELSKSKKDYYRKIPQSGICPAPCAYLGHVALLQMLF